MTDKDIVELGVASEETLGGTFGSPEVISKQPLGLSEDF